MNRKLLLSCGILASLLYATLNIIIPRSWPAYSPVTQTISELSAIGAPTRTTWNWLCSPYTFLMIAFAWGVWKSANQSRPLRIAAALLFCYGALSLLWPFVPMHMRPTLAADGATVSDALQIALGTVTEVIFLAALAFAAMAMGRHFCWYSIITFIILLFFGALTFVDAPQVAKNGSTPFIGVWERINIGVFLLWVIVLALMLLRKKDTVKPEGAQI